MVDDAYIVARYAENFVDFGSLVFNQGERVNALTSPLHAFIEAFLYWFTRNTITSYQWFTFLLLTSAIIALGVVLRKNIYGLFTSLSIVMLAPCILVWTYGGLETPILLFLITLLTVLIYLGDFRSRKLLIIFLTAGLVFLTRYDSVLFAIPLVLYASISARNWKNVVIAAMVGALIPAVWILTSYLYYGNILPTSYYVKTPVFNLQLMWNNFTYIMQYLLLIGVLPWVLFLLTAHVFKFRQSPGLATQTHHKWPIFLGLALTLGYGLSVAQTHMMFSFRFFVPYIPALTLLLANQIGRYSNDFENKQRRLIFELTFSLFFILVAVIQTAQIYITYHHSLNPVFYGNVEFKNIGIRESIEIMDVPMDVVNDVRSHWENLDKSIKRPPRIATYAAGIFPYYFKEAYIFESLVSYRHECRYNYSESADYVNILAPLHGTVEQQLPKPVENYELVVSKDLIFNGQEVTYLFFYDPEPIHNRLPRTLDASCQ